MELLLIAIGYIIGIILGLYFNISIALFLLFIFIIYMYFNKKIANLKRYLLCFSIALIISNLQINLLEKSFETKYENIQENVEIIGTIVTEPRINNNKVSYNLNVESIDKKNLCKNTKILVNVKNGNSNFKYGDKIIVYGELQDANVARNEGGFN